MILKTISCLSGVPFKDFSNIKRLRNLSFALKVGIHDRQYRHTAKEIFFWGGWIMLFLGKKITNHLANVSQWDVFFSLNKKICLRLRLNLELFRLDNRADAWILPQLPEVQIPPTAEETTSLDSSWCFLVFVFFFLIFM